MIAMPWSAEMKIRLVTEIVFASFLTLGWFCFEEIILALCFTKNELAINPLDDQQFFP